MAEILVPVVLNGANAGDATLRMSEPPVVRYADLRGFLSDRVVASALSTLDGLSTDWLSVDQLTAAGLEAAFDPVNLVLRIDIPVAASPASTIRLSGGEGPPQGERIQPADFSAALNFGLEAGLDWPSAGDPGYPQVPLSGNVSGFVNVWSWVLETQISLFDVSPYFSCGVLRIVKDWPSSRIRLMVGDVTSPTDGFQDAPSLQGIGVVRMFSLDPSYNPPEGSASITLYEPSTVQVTVNGSVQQIRRLLPGNYDLEDFQLLRGINEVQLDITGDSGANERRTFSFPFDDSLLPASETDFAYVLGIPRFQWKPPLLVGFQRFGVTPELTLGGFCQLALDLQMVGVDGLYATPVGNFQLTGGFSLNSALQPGLAARLEYRLAPLAWTSGLSVGLSGQYQSDAFMQNDATEAATVTNWSLAAFYSQKIFLDFGLGASY